MALKKKSTTIDRCRISNSYNLMPILDLGIQPLANSLKKYGDDSEEKFPLSVSFCPDSSLLQLNETINKETLFDHYVWVTGTSIATQKYANEFHSWLVKAANPDKKDLIIEIASNDGTFLRPLVENGYSNVLGIDPAKNIAQQANQQGIPTLPEFWDSSIAEKLLTNRGPAKVIFARNVLPHVSELLDIVQGIRNLLYKDGVGIIEFHDAGKIQAELHYDSIYHEHLCYFSIASITCLLSQFDLIPFHIEQSPISGGSWVIFFNKKKQGPSLELERAIASEEKNRVNQLSTWQSFANSSIKHKQDTLEILDSINGKVVVGFGSSARSQTYLNYCEINNSQITAIVDNNPLKQGLFTPGSSIPIVDIESGLGLDPDVIFILAWNFREEIVASCLAAGYKGQFMLPFPNKLHYFNGK